MIQLLKTDNSDLEKEKKRLMKRRDKYLSFILGGTKPTQAGRRFSTQGPIRDQ